MPIAYGPDRCTNGRSGALPFAIAELGWACEITSAMNGAPFEAETTLATVVQHGLMMSKWSSLLFTLPHQCPGPGGPCGCLGSPKPLNFALNGHW